MINPQPIFFSKQSELKKWFEKNHNKIQELLVGFYKKSSNKPSITYQEALDEALCFGWIDSIRRSIDDISYTIRFTPRKPKSYWSMVNIKRVMELKKLGRMKPSGLKTFRARDREKSEKYSFERRNVKLNPSYERKLKANEKAWDYFQSKPPSYQKPAIWWIMSAKQEETRLKRLARLIEDSENGRTIPPLTRPNLK
jgi:uncharacterized protein YdeI (YjbR/CyaY-like superfamily)